VLLKICEVGNPVLRKAARPLTPAEIATDQIQSLIEHMRDTMRDSPGVGLAAPQIGESLQIIVIEDKVEYHKGLTEAQLQERQRKPVDFHVIINPQIELLPSPIALFYEGCLSIPRLMAEVPRSLSVRVTCLNERAEPQTITAQGWYARILQHEIDHLNGRLYTDLMLPDTLTTIENYQRRLTNVSSTASETKASEASAIPVEKS
jgi:peptide deformylase